MFSVVQLRRWVNVVSNESSMCPGCCFGIFWSKDVRWSQTVAINMTDILEKEWVLKSNNNIEENLYLIFRQMACCVDFFKVSWKSCPLWRRNQTKEENHEDKLILLQCPQEFTQKGLSNEADPTPSGLVRDSGEPLHNNKWPIVDMVVAENLTLAAAFHMASFTWPAQGVVTIEI